MLRSFLPATTANLLTGLYNFFHRVASLRTWSVIAHRRVLYLEGSVRRLIKRNYEKSFYLHSQPYQCTRSCRCCFWINNAEIPLFWYIAFFGRSSNCQWVGLRELQEIMISPPKYVYIYRRCFKTRLWNNPLNIPKQVWNFGPYQKSHELLSRSGDTVSVLYHEDNIVKACPWTGLVWLTAVNRSYVSGNTYPIYRPWLNCVFVVGFTTSTQSKTRVLVQFSESSKEVLINLHFFGYWLVWVWIMMPGNKGCPHDWCDCLGSENGAVRLSYSIDQREPQTNLGPKTKP